MLCFMLWIPKYPITFLQTANKNYIWSLYYCYWYSYLGRAVKVNQRIMHCLTTGFRNLTSSALQQVVDWESSDASQLVLNQPNNQSAHGWLESVLVWVSCKRMNGEGSDGETLDHRKLGFHFLKLCRLLK